MAATEQDIENQKQLLAAHRQTLYGYLLQQAMHGRASVPPSVSNGINESRAEIGHIKQVLRDWGETVEDHPNDSALPNERYELVKPSESQSFAVSQSRESRPYAPYIMAIGAVLFIALSGLAGNQIGKQAVIADAMETVAPLQTTIADIAASSETKGREQTLASIRPTLSTLQTDIALATIQPATKLVTVTQIVSADPSLPSDILKIKSEWKTLYIDEFRTNDFNWPTFDEPAKDGKSAYKASFTENRYRVEVTAGKSGLTSRFAASGLVTGDEFYLEADVRKAIGDIDGSYGVVFHYNQSSCYTFRITNNGLFNIYRVEDGNYTPIMTGKAQVFSGEVNKISVLAQGDKYRFYVNNIEVASKEDTKLKQGVIGFEAGHVAGEHAVMEYDNLKVYVPPNS